MSRRRKQKDLESLLENVDEFSSPKLELEQYSTTAHIAGIRQLLYYRPAFLHEFQIILSLRWDARMPMVLKIGKRQMQAKV